MPEPVGLKSSGIGKFMTWVLYGCLGVMALLVGLGVVMLVTADTSGSLMSTALGLLGLFYLGLVPLLVVSIAWVIFFHRDLRAVFPDYPMSPLRAVLYMFIPFFNLFGLWRTFASISEYLRASGGEAGQLGDRANLFSTLGYLSIYVGNALYYFVTDISTRPGVGAGMDPKVFLALALSSTAFVVFYLNSMRLSQASLTLRARDGVAADLSDVLSYMK